MCDSKAEKLTEQLKIALLQLVSEKQTCELLVTIIIAITYKYLFGAIWLQNTGTAYSRPYTFAGSHFCQSSNSQN